MNNKIENITWTVSGKIDKITRTNGSTKPDLEFAYDAQGNRIRKIVKPSGSLSTPTLWTTTDYVRDPQGNVLAVYNGQFVSSAHDYKLKERYLYGSSLVGMDLHEEDMYVTTAGIPLQNGDPALKQFQLSNHLGNVLAVVNGERKAIPDNTGNAIDHFEAQLENSSDYYPFGSLLRERSTRWVWIKGAGYHPVTNPTAVELTLVNMNEDPANIAIDGKSYRFGFNGKENDNEVKGTGSQQDYGFRIYDPRLGKFLSVDPLAKQFPWYTPYQFSGNKVINSIDMDGAEELLVIRWYDNDKYIGQSYIYVPTSQRVLENGVVYTQAQYNNQSDRELWNLENTKNRDGHWNVSTQRSENFTTEQKQYIFIDNSENIQEGVLYSELPRNKKEGNRLSQLRTDFEGVPGTANKPGLNSTIVDYPGKLILNYKLNDSDVDGITNNGPLVEGYKRYLRDNPDFNLSVNGHTSPEGGDNINIPLSLDRANNVRNKLIEGGISGSRIKSQGFGSTSRNCQENSTDCYESNRRVEVTDGVPKN